MHKVIIPYHHPDPPNEREIEVAWLLARHFNCTVEFLIPIDDYMRKTPDIKMMGVYWEIKCPVGKSRTTISNQFKRATKQAKHIVFDARNLRFSEADVEQSVHNQMLLRPSVRRILLINKKGKILEITR